MNRRLLGILALFLCIDMVLASSSDVKLVLPGTKGAALSDDNSLPQSMALVDEDKLYLTDAWYGANYIVVDARSALISVRGILITHLHSDYVRDCLSFLMNA